MLTHQEGGDIVNVPLKKKSSRLARLGEQPLHSKYKNEGGERFCIQKLPPLHSRKKEHEGLRFLAPLSLLIAFCFRFWYFNSLQQVSVPSLMFLLSIDVLSSSFGASNCENMLIFVRQCWFALVLVFLNWGFEWKGLRPRLYSETMGHATLLPFSCNFCLNVRPPSARWNAPMIYEYDFAKLGWWGCVISFCFLLFLYA